MKESENYNRYFDKEAWCPLFGDLPPFEGGAPVSLVYRCFDAIKEARSLLAAIPFSQFKLLSAEYSQPDLETARTIFNCYDSVDQHAMERTYERSDGVAEGWKDTYTNWEFAVDFIRTFRCGMYFDNEWKDWAILAVFAIAEAWEALRNLLYYEESEGTEINLKHVLRAWLLLRLAENKASSI